MSKKLTKEEFIRKAIITHCQKYDYSNVDYINSKTKVIIICLSCKSSFAVLPPGHLRGYGCKSCHFIKLAKKHLMTHEKFLEKAKKIHGDKFKYLSEYKNARTKIKIKCVTCKKTINVPPRSHLTGHGCKFCNYNDQSNRRKFSVEEFEKLCKEIHKDRYEYFQDYTGIKNKIKIMCKTHGHIFYQSGESHKIQKAGCPKCRLSQGEMEIENFLIKNNIKYKQQKLFEECKNIKHLKFDFYLYNDNICIEYDGRQHFHSIEFFGGQKHLEEYQLNDNIKTDYCIQNNIKLIRIPYTKIKKIELILTSELNI